MVRPGVSSSRLPRVRNFLIVPSLWNWTSVQLATPPPPPFSTPFVGGLDPFRWRTPPPPPPVNQWFAFVYTHTPLRWRTPPSPIFLSFRWRTFCPFVDIPFVPSLADFGGRFVPLLADILSLLSLCWRTVPAGLTWCHSWPLRCFCLVCRRKEHFGTATAVWYGVSEMWFHRVVVYRIGVLTIVWLSMNFMDRHKC